MKYNPQQIEKKWQERWEKSGLYHTKDTSDKPKFYCLDMFPYPSAEGLHVGHWRGYVLSDIIARYQLLNGKNVLHPIGFDAFGLPAENAAIKAKSHPREFTNKAISNFQKQLRQIGAMFDWSKEVRTSDPGYYKWTQWIFLKLYKNGLAYRKKAPVNWCPSCQTVLANEQVISGECERCGSRVDKKDLTQWFLKITEYAEDLLNDLNGLDWPERVKTLQRNWIGKSEGAMVDFKVHNGNKKISVFTTRLDTLAGATFMVLAPEHQLVSKITTSECQKEVKEYIDKTRKISDIEREKIDKEKTGVFTGAYAINPITNKKIPIWISDYVLLSYGTGAVMCVPAHDNRDFEFAKKFKLEIKQVIAPEITYHKTPPKEGLEWIERDAVESIVYNPKTKKYLCLEWKKLPWTCFITGGVDESEDAIKAAKREIFEETGYKNVKFIKSLGRTRLRFHAAHKNCNRLGNYQGLLFELENDDRVEPSGEEKEIHEVIWLSRDELTEKRMICASYEYWMKAIDGKEEAFEGSGSLVDSGKFSKLNSGIAKIKIIEHLNQEGIAEPAVNYRLRDWLISRQRYWGAPIPIIYCDKCGEVAVPEKDLPVKLPEDIEFKPHGDSPLKQSTKFLNVKCPSCGGNAQRETDTMDTFVDSSWYYLRYTDPTNEKELARQEKVNFWMPVDFYVGGIEHAILHLLYARFISKALHKIGVVSFNKNGEPFQKLFNIGMVYLHGSKMSKSKGNIVSPDELIEKYGTDALRGYELFIGPADLDSEWQIQGITGVYRFLEKVWNFYQSGFKENNEKDAAIEKTIQTVTMEIEEIRPNTAISHLMELFNYLKTKKAISKEYLRKINILLSPFFPHLSEELWENAGNKESIFEENWPSFDEDLLKNQKAKIAIQINGKVKADIETDVQADQKQVESDAKNQQVIKHALQGATIKKVVYVPGRILNFVIE
ncbi:leucine--tRNA ligase [Candidatus Berkelbacteria bacterium RBG_13_40_8]|uniref:Leucine--tRNA ligase n=1 Tax=Candidatus Berkelbacteria bacterium RBG_13_40_8 TaxID=1797467 RepID=A0A1F5DQL1_9BACT|nr:MAG: leucine--tRNA ligase [Candidatus Berkelbacteria bacterium RBG_13_40_8]